MLWHIAAGYFPGFVDSRQGQAGWVKMSHRGVQRLDRVVIPRKQKPYVFHPKWEIRMDTAFESVVRACADVTRQTIQKRAGRTWITPELIRGLLALHASGHAHSYEAWCDGQLAGGVWGFQLGSFVSMNSMFHHVSNASKAAFARGQLLLRERGFALVDMNGVPDHLVDFGIEWMPQEVFEGQVLRDACVQRDIDPRRPGGAVPRCLQVGIHALRGLRSARRSFRKVLP